MLCRRPTSQDPFSQEKSRLTSGMIAPQARLPRVPTAFSVRPFREMPTGFALATDPLL